MVKTGDKQITLKNGITRENAQPIHLCGRIAEG